MTDELLNALKLIKAECEKYKYCEGCPMLSQSDECGVMSDKPTDWSLEKREVYF